MYLPWKYALASTVGTSHQKTGQVCQDASSCQTVVSEANDQILIAVASDGAGSANFSEHGSKLICTSLTRQVKEHIQNGGEVRDIYLDLVKDWIMMFQKEANTFAEEHFIRPKELACTLLAAILGGDYAAFIQIGDGAIVTTSPEEGDNYSWVFWPQNGEYENTTFFATDSYSLNHLNFDVYNGHCDEVALFSDGLQRIALHYETKTAHNPFFRPFFLELRKEKRNYSKRFSDLLVTFLNSTRVSERSDDDKTLILVTRRNDKLLKGAV
jgi:hypothetical protein